MPSGGDSCNNFGACAGGQFHRFGQAFFEHRVGEVDTDHHRAGAARNVSSVFSGGDFVGLNFLRVKVPLQPTGAGQQDPTLHTVNPRDARIDTTRSPGSLQPSPGASNGMFTARAGTTVEIACLWTICVTVFSTARRTGRTIRSGPAI